MKATDLNRALNYVDDAYLMEADTPYKVIETESKEIKPMKTQKRAFRILLAAALIGVLSITAYAAEMLPIHKLESGKTKHYESYSDVDRAIAQVGLEVSVPEEFENGFRFQGVDVDQTIGKDVRDEKVLTYRQLSVSYENPQGQELTLLIRADMKEVSETESIPSISRTGRNLEKNILKTLARKLKNDREWYEKFWNEYGKSLKIGKFKKLH